MTSTHEHIEFRTVQRSEAYLPGTGLSVWEVVWINRGYDGDISATADHLNIASDLIEEALVYAGTHAAEIDSAIAELQSRTVDDLLKILPGMRVIVVDAEVTGSLDA